MYPELGNELVTAGPADAELGFIATWIAGIPTLRWTVQIEYGIGGNDVMYITKTNDIPNANWWAEGAWRKLLVTSDTLMFNPEFDDGYEARMRVLPTVLITGANGVQALREGIDHCVFGPLKKFYEGKLAETTAKSQISRLQTNIKKCDKLAEKYKKGIPHDALSAELVSMETTVGIMRVDGRDQMILNKAGRWRVDFLSTRWNHVDVMLADSNPERIGVVEMRSAIKQLMEMKKPFTFEGDLASPRAIETAAVKYRCAYPYDDMFAEFNESIGRKYFRVDYVAERGLWEYITASIRQNNHVKFQPIPKGAVLKEVDCIRGYTQFKRCPWYRGFLGCVWDWCGDIDYETMKKFIGIYTIRVLSASPFAQYVCGFVEGRIVTLISPMIEMMVDKGWITCEIMYGIYGSKADFEFPETFNQKYDDKSGVLGDKGVPLYSLWSGMTASITQNRILRHHTGLALCRSLRDAGENIKWVYADECYDFEMVRGNRVRRLKEGVLEMEDPPGYGEQYIDTEMKNNTPQLFSFISNYMRMNMLLEMEQFSGRLSDLYVCKLDSIVYSGAAEFSSLMRVKEGEIKVNFGMSTRMFNPCMYNRCEYYPTTDEFPPIGSCLFAGSGGAGKSHRASKMRGLLYSAPMWSANIDFKNNFGCNMVMPYQSVLGVGCEAFLDKGGCFSPATIFWDEATMLPETHKMLALKVSPHIRQIYAGDFDTLGRPFQTVLCANSAECLSVIGMPRVDFLTDWRCISGDPLVGIKVAMREIMFNHYGDTKRLVDYVRSVIRSVPVKFVIDTYTLNDWVLAGTHVNCNEWTTALWARGLHKWRINDKGNRCEVMKALAGKEAYVTGTIVLKEIEGRCIPSHAFTIHSVQGKTVASKIFIDMRSVTFNYCLLYTAVSRARSLSQLYLVY